ncbi:hypothetical protein QTI33_08045 [Variovorax sp. J22P271]|nr:hypothetical protein [Variovorax sp. J22P271]MDM0032089.1 hypothetical protein [Variovorax sp. J22P271]
MMEANSALDLRAFVIDHSAMGRPQYLDGLVHEANIYGKAAA